MIILCGKTGSGKTTVGLELEKDGFKKVVVYTTRPMRPGEIDGIDYHFVTEEKFVEMMNEGFFAETASYNASFGFCRYGSLKTDYTEGKKYIILNPIGLKQVLKNVQKTFVVYLYVDETELVERLKKRGDTSEETTRRLATDRKDFADIQDYVNVTINSVGKPSEIKECILEFYNAFMKA